jgi:hypothetical protein
MAGAHVVHVGEDHFHRTTVLRSAGYVVEQCETLPKMLEWFRSGQRTDVVCISEAPDEPAEGAIAAARVISDCPVVLFRASAHRYVQQQWDLEVSPLTDPTVWLGDLAGLLALTRANIEASRQCREQSRQLREEAAQARKRSELLRKQIGRQLKDGSGPER